MEQGNAAYRTFSGENGTGEPTQDSPTATSHSEVDRLNDLEANSTAKEQPAEVKVSERHDSTQVWHNAGMFRDVLPESTAGPYVALLLEVLMIVLLIVVIYVNVPLKRMGSISTAVRSVYILGIAIGASIIAAYVACEACLLWTHRILNRASTSKEHSKKNFKRIISVLGIGTMRDDLRFWPVLTSLIMMDLTITTIWAGLSPYPSQTSANTSVGLFYNALGPCFQVQSSPSTGNWFSWKLDNGSYLTLNATVSTTDTQQRAATCPILNGIDFFAGTSSESTQFMAGWGYDARGNLVNASALGAPFSAISGPYGFSQIFDPRPNTSAFVSTDWHLLEKASACLPVLVRNPVQCTAAGQVTVDEHAVSVSADACNITTPIFSVDPRSQAASALGACTSATNGSAANIGKATILIGAVGQHATALQGYMGRLGSLGKGTSLPPLYSIPNSSQQALSVQCSVDIEPTVSFRTLDYAPQYGGFASNNANSGSLDASIGSGSEQTFSVAARNADFCTPSTGTALSSILTPGTLAHGAAASYQFLAQNAYRDGWWDGLWNLAQESQSNLATKKHDPGNSSTSGDQTSSLFNFPNSHNALEDALGLISAAVMGMYWGYSPNEGIAGVLSQLQGSVTGNNSGRPSPWTTGVATYGATRVGPGQSFALIYLIPELWTVGVLLYLLYWDRFKSTFRKMIRRHK